MQPKSCFIQLSAKVQVTLNWAVMATARPLLLTGGAAAMVAPEGTSTHRGGSCGAAGDRWCLNASRQGGTAQKTSG